MSDTNRGKSIFEELVQYPLPARAGVKDYVIYFVPEDGYGKGARRFFAKFFPNHVSKAVQSLEELMGYLSGEIRAGRVQQIREIVMVAHGNAQGLIIPVLASIGPATQVYKYVTAFSLTCLQKDLAGGQFASFNTNRRQVAAHLSEASWVTLRACNFGQSREGMYALYSFFGGKANLYAPQVYQFFGWHPVMEGFALDIEEKNGKVVTHLRQNPNRLDSKLAVHQHLVRQRYLPRDIHTPDRIDTIVNFYLDKARFSEPFPLAAVKASDTTSEDAVRYDQMRSDLNNRKISPALKARFSEQGMQMTAAARVTVRSAGSDWIIRDKLVHDGKAYSIEYRIEQRTDFLGAGNSERFVLWAEARVVDLFTSNQGLPIQRFFEEGEHRIYQAQLFTLASYSDDAGEDPALKAGFESLVAMLDHAKIKEGPADLVAEFKAKGGIDLGATATVTVRPPTGAAPRLRKSWLINDQTGYLIKLEYPRSSTGVQAYVLMVYRHLDNVGRMLHSCEILPWIGEDPDTPGPELAASLDRYSIDDLTRLIDYLRAPYKAQNSVYLYHAQQAILRRRESLAWWQQLYGEAAKTQPLVRQPYAELSFGENDDRRSLVYDFDFPRYWREVKASDPPPAPVEQDLFAEELLWKHFRMKEEDLAVRTDPDEIEPDSPFNNDDDVRLAETRGLDRYVSVEKYIADAPETPDVSCAEFRQIVEKWKGLQGQDAEEIRKALDLEKTVNGRTFFETLTHYWEKLHVGHVLMGLALWNIASVKEGFVEKIAARLPLISESVIIRSFLSVMPAITIPLSMWMKFLKEQERTEEAWENVGRITAARQWLRMLEELTYRRESNFPDTISLDVSNYISANPYFVGRYYQEQIDQSGMYYPFIYAPTRMKKGFDEAAALMNAAGNELMRQADEFIDETINETTRLDACKINVLKELGVIDVSRMRALVLRQVAKKLLEKLPNA